MIKLFEIDKGDWDSLGLEDEGKSQSPLSGEMNDGMNDWLVCLQDKVVEAHYISESHALTWERRFGSAMKARAYLQHMKAKDFRELDCHGFHISYHSDLTPSDRSIIETI